MGLTTWIKGRVEKSLDYFLRVPLDEEEGAGEGQSTLETPFQQPEDTASTDLAGAASETPGALPPYPQPKVRKKERKWKRKAGRMTADLESSQVEDSPSTPIREEDISIMSDKLGQETNEEMVKISVKHPRQYSDTEDIVDLLMRNECILIDFQYMLDAQSRRCIDYIQGASKVLYGNLQKVSSSMYLLTPSNVVLDLDDLPVSQRDQEVSFDFDMKRR